jgi:hypothetical protein
MTSETRHLVQMADIRGLEIACPNDKCSTKLIVTFISTEPIPGVCPLCKKPLFDPATSEWAFAKQLRAAISDLLNRNVTNLRLEIIGIKQTGMA